MPKQRLNTIAPATHEDVVSILARLETTLDAIVDDIEVIKTSVDALKTDKDYRAGVSKTTAVVYSFLGAALLFVITAVKDWFVAHGLPDHG